MRCCVFLFKRGRGVAVIHPQYKDPYGKKEDAIYQKKLYEFHTIEFAAHEIRARIENDYITTRRDYERDACRNSYAHIILWIAPFSAQVEHERANRHTLFLAGIRSPYAPIQMHNGVLFFIQLGDDTQD